MYAVLYTNGTIDLIDTLLPAFLRPYLVLSYKDSGNPVRYESKEQAERRLQYAKNNPYLEWR